MGRKDLKTFKNAMERITEPEMLVAIRVSPWLFTEIDKDTRKVGKLPCELVWSFGSIDVPIRKDVSLKDFDYRLTSKPADKQRWEIESMNNNIKTFMDAVKEIRESCTVDSFEVSPFLYHELVRASKPSLSPEPATLTWGLPGGYRVPVFKALNLGGFEFRVLYKPVEERVERVEVELLDMQEANEAIREFEEAMQQVKETERLAKIAIGEKLYNALNAVDKGDVWLFEDFVDVPIQLDKSLGAYRHVLVYHAKAKPAPVQYPIPMPSPPADAFDFEGEDAPRTTAHKNVTNVRINDVSFDDLTAELYARSLVVYADATADTSLVMTGFVDAVRMVEERVMSGDPIKITVTSQDASKPWVTYTSVGSLRGFRSVNKEGGFSRRTTELHFDIIHTQSETDKDLEPSIHMAINKNEASNIVASLIREKQHATADRMVHINSALEHLQILIKESGE